MASDPRLTDADLERLLRGHVPDERPDLAAAGAFAAVVADMGHHVPQARGTLAVLLAEGFEPAAIGAAATPATQPAPSRWSALRRPAARLAGLSLALKVVAGSGVALAAVGGAAGTGVLPETVQDRVGAVLESVTPFEFPGADGPGTPAGPAPIEQAPAAPPQDVPPAPEQRVDVPPPPPEQQGTTPPQRPAPQGEPAPPRPTTPSGPGSAPGPRDAGRPDDREAPAPPRGPESTGRPADRPGADGAAEGSAARDGERGGQPEGEPADGQAGGAGGQSDRGPRVAGAPPQDLPSTSPAATGPAAAEPAAAEPAPPAAR